MSSLNELLSKVKAATGPDRELDILFGKVFPPKRIDSDGSWFEADDIVRFPPLTASVDAALAFAERALPGFEYEITNLYGIAMASLPMNMSSTLGFQTARREDGNMPLAIIAATLTAILSQEPDHDHQ